MIIRADARAIPLRDGSIQCCVCSPPYWGLRDYGVPGQMGMESSPEEYVAGMVAVFREVRRVLRDDGTLWLNLGDSYAAGGRGGGMDGEKGEKQRSNEGALLGPKKAPAGLKPKDLVGIPWRVAFALQADGWYLRSDIIWSKPNPMPESVTDRPTKAHEYIFLLTKEERYFYDAEAVKEAYTESTVDRMAYSAIPREGKSTKNILQAGDGNKTSSGVTRTTAGLVSHEARDNGGRNRRTVWTVATQPYAGAHFATFPEKLIEPCILAGCPKGGIVLDPFGGSGTTVRVARRFQRKGIALELNPAYIDLARERIVVQTEIIP